MPVASIYDTKLVHAIKKLYDSHLPMSAIAAEFGMTKNQIVGIVNSARRHGYSFPLRSRSKQQNTEFQKLRKREAKLKTHKLSKAIMQPIKKKEVQANELKDLYAEAAMPEVIPPEGLPLLVLSHKACRYSIGEEKGVFLFCAQPNNGRSPYCEKHHKLMYSGIVRRY
jgi:hypothetical protein